MNVKTISWTKSGYQLDGKPGFLVSGEFHYFRVPRGDWERRLELFRQAGGNAVATYVPWVVHEPNEGQFCFGDTDHRDVEGFLSLCREMGFAVTVRPGPYQYSEMLHGGLPHWLVENHPEILAEGPAGGGLGASSVSYLHPLFLEKARAWYARVCPLLARHMASRGGPIQFAQFDNELMGIHLWNGGWDHHPETMGFGRDDGRFPKFLAGRYGSPETLNASWGTHYARFADARPLRGKHPATRGEQRQARDYQEFYFQTIAEYSATLAGWMREFGIDCDLVHNSANPSMNANFLETVERMRANGERFLLGSDHYYNLNQNWEQNNPTPAYALKNFCSNAQLSSMGFPPTVFELPGGSASDWPPITPEDLQCSFMMNVAFGMKGLNYYIFTGGMNPGGIGIFDSYDYQAPISANGEVRPTYYALERFGRFLQAEAWLAEAEQVVDFHVGMVWDYVRSDANSLAEPGEFSGHEAWLFTRKGILTTAFCGSLAPGLLDMADESPLPTDKPLLLPTATALSRQAQLRLVDFVERGGCLLIVPVLPVLDENFQACRILADFVDAGEIKAAGISPRLSIGPVDNVQVLGSLWVTEAPPAGSISIAHEERSGHCAGWRLKRGLGEVFWLGLDWKHSKHEHALALRWLISQMGLETPLLDCSNPCIWTSLRTNGERAMIFAMNFFSSPMEGRLELKNPRYAPLSVDIRLKPMEVGTFDVSPAGES